MKKKVLTFILFILYILCIIDIILFKFSIPPITGVYNEINLIPFYGEHIKALQVILNIIIFIPFGIYLSLMSNHRNTENVLFGFIFIIVLEALEHLLGTGILDITDIITNTLGVYMGRLSYNMTSKFMKKDHLDKLVLITASICTLLVITFLVFTHLKNI